MRWNKILALPALLGVLLLLCVPAPALAQDYGFSLDKEVVDVWINQDGSVTLYYQFTFTCDAGAHPIDVVDLGLPTGDYAISGIRGDVDNRPVQRVDSDYQGDGDHGVAVWLGNETIQPGNMGTVRVNVERVGRMVFEDTDDTEYASTEFSPTWFDGDFAHGTTDMTVRFHLPEGVQPEEPRWHKSPSGWPAEPETALDEDGRVLYTWVNPAARPDRQYTFGASFPRQYVAEDAIQKGPGVLEAFLGLFTSAASCCCNPVTLVGAGFVTVIGFSIWNQRRRKMKYLPPSMKIEGVGVKRGLTAAEAAILLETPLDRVMSMILFGLLKKGAVTVLDDKPLKLKANEPLPGKLRPYESDFLEAIKKDHTLSESRLRKLTVALIKEVNNKIKGFSRKESVVYYRDIVRRAWLQVEGAATPEIRGQRFDEGLEWTMLDDDFDDRVGRTFRTGPVFVPLWWGHYRPWASVARPGPATATSRPSSGSRPSTGRVQLPTLPGAAFAASIVTGVQSTASNIVGNLTGFTGGVTAVTNPPPKPSSSGRSGGGSSCACACACAGCACACAGGGR